MKPIKVIFKHLFLVSLLVQVLGCGNGTNNVDPLNFLSGDSFPPLEPIVTATGYGSTIQVPFTASTPYWDFVSAFNTNQAVLSPGAGKITSMGNSGSGNYIRILHSNRLSTQITGVQISTLRAGDYVTQGQSIGFFSPFSTNIVRFQVFVDNVAVCPLSFLSSTFRQNLQSFGVIPCR